MLRVSWWRGALVVLAWVTWPVLAFLMDLVVRLLNSTGRGCSVEGCNFTPGLVEWGVYVLPPLLGTAWWWRWRRHRGTDSARAGAPR